MHFISIFKSFHFSSNKLDSMYIIVLFYFVANMTFACSFCHIFMYLYYFLFILVALNSIFFRLQNKHMVYYIF